MTLLMDNGHYGQHYQDGYYMAQEEEWDREGLLDPAWEKQQKKVGAWGMCFERGYRIGVSSSLSIAAWCSAVHIRVQGAVYCKKFPCKNSFPLSRT